MTKLLISLYRTSAFVVSFAIIAIVIGYIGLLVFYIFSSSWIAPIILSSNSEKMLTIRTQLFNADQSISKLYIENNRLESTIVSKESRKQELIKLQNKISLTIENEIKANKLKIENINSIPTINTQEILTQADFVEHNANTDLKAGIITKTQHAAIMTSVEQLRASSYNSIAQKVTLNNIKGDLVRANITLLDGNSDIKSLDIAAKEIEIRTQINEISIDLKAAREQLDAGKLELRTMQNTIEEIKETPYFKVAQTPENHIFAFVPYDNENAMNLNEPIYDCFLHMILCRKVGEVSQIYKNEELIHHPLFSGKMLRGILIGLSLEDIASAKSKVLFVGSKPLFF